MKVAKQRIACEEEYLAFEPESPYTERFMEIQRRISEVGIWKNREMDSTGELNEKTRGPDEINKLVGEFSWKQVISILVFGYSISIILFVAEFTKDKWFE